MGNELFPLLTRATEITLRNMNPWWSGEKFLAPEVMKRWAFEPLLRSLHGELSPATVLRGPRQVGKTTLQNQLIAHLLDEGMAPKRILRVQFDELPALKKLGSPLIEITEWYAKNILGKSLNQAVLDGERPYVFLDEVQNLPDWAPQLKHLVDIGRVRALVTGSSALRIEAGRDSLAGRIFTIDVGPLLLREIAALHGMGTVPPHLPFNGLSPLKEKSFWQSLRAHGEKHADLRHRAFAAFSERGGYPRAQASSDEPWERVADFLVETVVKRAIQHDLRLGPRGKKRDENLLEEIFRLACRYAGQSPKQATYVEELNRGLHANIGWQRVLAYLKFLDGSLLLRLIEPAELRLKKRKGPAKVCLCDPALRRAWLQEEIPLDPTRLAEVPEQADLAGHIAESVAGYFFASITGLDVAWFPEMAAEPEVDFVLTVGDQRIPVEIKYRRRIKPSDTLGLRAFIEKSVYRAPFGILITQLEEPGSDDPRIVSLPLSTLLMLR